jgi:hypothetical protein
MFPYPTQKGASMKRILSLVAAVAASAPAYAVDWRVVGDNTDLPAIIAFVDRDSVKQSGGYADFVLIYYLEGETEATDVGVRQQRRAQCPGSGFQVLSERRWLGPTEQPQEAVDQTFKNAASGSIDQAVIDMVCGTRVYNSAKIADPDQYAKDFFADLAYEEGY